MKIVICDDNCAYADEIKRTVNAFFSKREAPVSIDVFYDSKEPFDSNIKYDIAFLDIEMEPYSGIQLAKKLKETNPYIVVFIITSYNNYIDDAMDLNVFRYIQKPLETQRLILGLEKALKNIDNSIITFYLKQDNKAISVLSNEIVYIETVGRATKIVTTQNTFLSDNKMDFWKEKLIASFFYRVHKSFIVNMKYITSYQRDTIVLLKKYSVPISYRKQAEFRHCFLNFIGGI